MNVRVDTHGDRGQPPRDPTARSNEGSCSKAEGSSQETNANRPRRRPSSKLKRFLWRGFLFLLVFGGGWGFQAWIYGVGFISSSSMEGSLLPGDVVVIQRTGGRLSGGITQQPRGLGGGGWERGDIVVLQPRDGESAGISGGAGPPDGRSVKRIVAMPGETVEVYGGTLLVNGVLEAEPTTLLDVWTLTTSASLRTADLYAKGIRDVRKTPDGYVIGPASRTQIASLRAQETIDDAARCQSCTDSRGRWHVPQRGVPVVPDGREEAQRLARLIQWYENRDATVTPEGDLVIDHVEVGAHAFQDDYVFVVGDNRAESLDSRSWGPVPVSFLRGRVVRVIASWSHRDRTLRPGRLWSQPEQS